MENNLISWGEVLKRYEISHQELVQLCNEGLQVFDRDENKIFATSQCKYTPIEPPLVTWGRIVFDMEQDELIFSKEFVENELFKIKFFPKTGDFVLARKDIPLSIYDQNIFAHLMNIEFPAELTQDFFKKVHKAGDESYSPTADLKNEERLEFLFPLLDIEKGSQEISTVELTITTDSKKLSFDEITIPYILKQKFNRSRKQCELKIKLHDKHFFNFISPESNSENDPNIKLIINLDCDTMLTNRQDYVNALQKKEITIEANNIYYLKFFVNDRWALAPHFGCISKYFSNFNIPSLNDENYFNDLA